MFVCEMTLDQLARITKYVSSTEITGHLMSFLWKSPTRPLPVAEVERALFQRRYVCEPSSSSLLAGHISVWMGQFFILVYKHWNMPLLPDLFPLFPLQLYPPWGQGRSSPLTLCDFPILAHQRVNELQIRSSFLLNSEFYLILPTAKLQLGCLRSVNQVHLTSLRKMANAQYQVPYLFRGHLY